MTTNSTIRSTTDRPAGTMPGPWTGGGGRSPASRLRAANHRRGLPHLLLGVLLVLACAGGFVLISVNSGDRRAVLALARDVSVGRVLGAQDLRQVQVAVDQGVAVVGADRASAVVGRPMATSLSAGALLTPDSVGGAVIPAEGQAVAALALKPGQFPPEVAAGARVAVVPVSDQPVAGGLPAGEGVVWPAVVVSVTTSPGDQSAVVSVQLGEAAARQVAAVGVGELSIVVLSGGGR